MVTVKPSMWQLLLLTQRSNVDVGEAIEDGCVLYRAYLLIREKRAMEDARRNQRSLMAHANTAIRIGHQFLQNGMV
ncbi:hypothetical protein BofuT4_uP050080.1 [Botrytis cinerea T4]|uniref:Uncharacterized protein n=1 Tax=Botryotinia fuckeliana (strain T4) TaxID=999810 RepID=G2XZV3_BOTF4|nr:hypothetical protein BofuT4_uP050080.1 [Botrytis cinerea T4]